MQRVLFHSTVFGPIHSRRLGTSLGINLSPDDGKVCTFDCLYCEAGFNAQGPGTTGLPPRDKVKADLISALETMNSNGLKADVITFSGNGEPTMHPDFAAIIDDTIAVRDRLMPSAKISVLSNSTCLSRPDVAAALKKVDNNILKLDSAIESTMQVIDRPVNKNFTSEKAICLMEQFAGQCIVQTMLLRGMFDGKVIDNTTAPHIQALIDAYRRIKPRQVMVYSIDRATPAPDLQKLSHDELIQIADRIHSATGIPVSVA